MEIPLGHGLLFLLAFLAGLVSDNKRTCKGMVVVTLIIGALICLAWQAGNSYPGLLVSAFVDLYGQLTIVAVLGVLLGKGGLELIKRIPKKVRS